MNDSPYVHIAQSEFGSNPNEWFRKSTLTDTANEVWCQLGTPMPFSLHVTSRASGFVSGDFRGHIVKAHVTPLAEPNVVVRICVLSSQICPLIANGAICVTTMFAMRGRPSDNPYVAMETPITGTSASAPLAARYAGLIQTHDYG